MTEIEYNKKTEARSISLIVAGPYCVTARPKKRGG